MEEKAKKTAIRFAGFTEDWEQRKLGEVAEIRRGLTYKPDDVKTSGIRVLRSSNINEEYFETYKDDVFVDEVAINIPYVKNGDIIITSANGSSRLVGKHAIIKNIPDNSVVHGGFMLVASTNEPEFLNSSMSSPWYTKFINIYVSGGNGAIGNLSKSDLENKEILVPPVAEQRKIGLFFSHLDHLITLHQRKYEKLVNFKKSCLEKMFPKNGSNIPEVRFNGFTETWEQRKLASIAEEITRTSQNSDAPVMMITAQNGFIEQSERYAFNNAGESLKKYILIEKGEMAYNHGASKLRPYGSCFSLTILESARIPFVYHCFSVGENDPEFVSMELNGIRVENQLRKIVSSGARMDGLLNISYEEYSTVEIMLPSIPEQKILSEYFAHLDHLITLHQRKLEKLQNFKKACLEKMFVYGNIEQSTVSLEALEERHRFA